MNVILKETRKYGLHLVLCTQNLISGRNRSDLKRNVLSNTNIKIIGSNSIGNLKPLSTETDITLAHLLNLKSFEFYLKSGDSEAFKIRTKDVLGSRSPLLLNR